MLVHTQALLVAKEAKHGYTIANRKTDDPEFHGSAQVLLGLVVELLGPVGHCFAGLGVLLEDLG